MKHFGFPSIDQYRNAVRTVRDRCEYHGLPLPTITFQGTVKLHGTNAGVVQDLRTGEVWAQSREQCITPLSDNAGFARFVDDNGIVFKNLFKTVQDLCGSGDDLSKPTHLAIFGEWCGKGIMKGVAINQLEKRFVIFGVRVITDGEEPILRWLSSDQVKKIVNSDSPRWPWPNDKIFCIYNFQTWELDIDFSKPELAQNELVRITNEVEAECPVGKFFGVSGIGEGVVWEASSVSGLLRSDDLIFKVKGEKHSDTKVKTTAEVDPEKIANARAFADAVCTDHRLEKMVEKLKEAGVALDIKNTGAFLKLVGQDVIKEESDRLTVSDLDWKDVASVVNANAKQWWMKLVNTF